MIANAEQLADLPRHLYTFHGCGLGDVLDVEASRAVVLVRLVSLCRGVSGVSLELLERLAWLLEHDVVPVIPSEGSVGASGDLTPLSYLAAVLCGEREVFDAGRRRPALDAFAERGLTPYRLRPKEGLALMNGTAVMTALACLAWERAELQSIWCEQIAPVAVPQEAAPAFGGMLCCLVLVPFGVLAPLFFLVDGPSVLLLNKSRLMGALVLAVFVFVTVLTTAANASMDRIKTEKKSKLAGHALRLALRANSVIADGNCARQLFDVRHHHVEMATAALRRRPDAGNARNGRPLTERQHSRVQDAADRALLDDLKRSELRYENVVDASQKALAEVSQPSTGLDALKLRRRNAHASYEMLIREDRLLQDEGLYYWKPTEKDEHSMSIINLPVLIDTISKQYAHDHLIAEAHAKRKRKRQEQEEKHHTPREVSLQIELPSCLKCHRKKRDAPIHVEEKQVDPATLKLRNEARVAIDAWAQRKDLPLRPVHTAANIASALSLILTVGGFSLLPKYADQLLLPRVITRPLVDGPSPIPLMIGYRPKNASRSRHLMEAVRKGWRA